MNITAFSNSSVYINNISSVVILVHSIRFNAYSKIYCTHCFCISTFNYLGTSASAAHFQAYLLEDMMCWNQDRETAATISDAGSSTYSGEIRHAANVLRMDVFGSMLFPDYQPPRKYNGMLIFFQTVQ